MAVHSAVGATKRGSAPVTQAAVLPAPINGMDATAALSANDLSICLFAENLTPSQYGLKVRKGYREWEAGLGNEVRTIIPYAGEQSDKSDDRLFAVTPDGIFDVTVDGGAPVSKFVFLDNTGDAGVGVYSHYVDSGGVDRLFYADGANGLFEYDKLTDTWAQAAGIVEVAGSINTFVVEDISFIVVHKLRLWMIPRNSSYAWYLPILSTKGDATEFFFGGKFRHGGELVGLFNWTNDGGDGVDDKLVAISRAGDVIPYEGEDPSLATWRNIGTFFVGEVPKGPRIASEYGGLLYILSTFGVTTMRDLLNGIDVTDEYTASIGFKIARLLRQQLTRYKDDIGWDLRFFSQEGQLVIIVPQFDNGIYRQWALNLSTRGWGVWNNIPALSGDVWQGEMAFGTKDGRVLRSDVSVDNVANDGSGGEAIKFYVLTTYSDFGSPGIYKRVVNIRPNFIANITPAFKSTAKYDYSVTAPTTPPTTAVVSGALWDAGLWDDAVWQGSDLLPFFTMEGADGVGRTIGIAMSGESYTETYLGSWDIAWNEGHFR